ncbi:MAG TPA: hypothetical protein VGB04_14405 [Allosphingosinicella sp.]|jgi:hypothetical protein
MTQIRFRPVSAAQLRPIREARPTLAALTGRRQDRPEDVPGSNFGQAHAVHVLGLRDLVEGSGISEAPVAIRVMEGRGPEKGAYYDLSPSADAPELMQVAASDNDYGSLLGRGVAAATRWAEGRGRPADVRMLRVPALYTEALLLRDEAQEEETAIVIRTLQEGIGLLEPMPLSELLRRLEAPARLILANEGGGNIA